MKLTAAVLAGALACIGLSGQAAMAGQAGSEAGFKVAALAAPALPPVPGEMDAIPAPPVRQASLEPDEEVQRILFRSPTLAPMAFIRFCLRYPRECSPGTGGPVAALTKERKAHLARVNREVNGAIRPVANTAGVTAERWDLSPRSGDCNDYAVTKRHRLMAEGWPAQALLLAEVALSTGEHHLVLVVRTGDGDDLLLDNLATGLRTAAQAPYRWVRAQRPDNPRLWSNIEGPAGGRLVAQGG